MNSFSILKTSRWSYSKSPSLEKRKTENEKENLIRKIDKKDCAKVLGFYVCQLLSSCLLRKLKSDEKQRRKNMTKGRKIFKSMDGKQHNWIKVILNYKLHFCRLCMNPRIALGGVKDVFELRRMKPNRNCYWFDWSDVVVDLVMKIKLWSLRLLIPHVTNLLMIHSSLEMYWGFVRGLSALKEQDSRLKSVM